MSLWVPKSQILKRKLLYIGIYSVTCEVKHKVLLMVWMRGPQLYRNPDLCIYVGSILFVGHCGLHQWASVYV